MSERSAAAKRDLLARLLRERAARPQAAPKPRSPGADLADTGGPALVPLAREGDLGASFGQERIWFLEQLQPESLLYNLLARIGFSGALDVEALRRSVETIVARHEVLRTTFPSVDGRPVQRISSPPTWVLPVRDLRSLPASAREAEAERLARSEVTTPFDLVTGPLLRTVLLRLDDAEHVLVLTIHHIVSDAWSVNLFFHELATCYAAFVAGTPPALPALPVQYADFAHWQRELAHGRGARDPAWLLDGAVVRDAAGARPPGGSAAALGSEVPRSHPCRRGSLDRADRVARSQPWRGRHAVHDAAGGLQGVAAALHGPGGSHRRHPGRRAQSTRGRAPHGVLRQYARPAHRSVGGPNVPGGAAADTERRGRRPGPRGLPVRAIGGGAAAGA